MVSSSAAIHRSVNGVLKPSSLGIGEPPWTAIMQPRSERLWCIDDEFNGMELENYENSGSVVWTPSRAGFRAFPVLRKCSIWLSRQVRMRGYRDALP